MRSILRLVFVVSVAAMLLAAGIWLGRLPTVSTYLFPGEASSSAASDLAAAPAAADRKPLYYRNPMGLPDVSPTPKKDSMGMDYIPVYAEDASQPASTVKVSLDKV